MPGAARAPLRPPSLRAVRRAARGEIDDAVRALAGDAPIGDRVHEVRTGIKKARAFGRLFGWDAGSDAGGPAHKVDRRLRAAARSVSALRDAEVLLAAFDRLLVPSGPAPAAGAGPDAARRLPLDLARAQLASRLAAETHALGRGGCLARLQASLRRARRHIQRWTVKGRRHGGRRVVARAMVEGYRRARRAMARAASDRQGARLHAWRRATKRHFYQLRLFEGARPDGLGARLAELDALGDRLGEEHDLVLLEAELAVLLGGDARRRALAAARHRRRALRAEAFALGRRLFADKPRQLARRLDGRATR